MTNMYLLLEELMLACNSEITAKKLPLFLTTLEEFEREGEIDFGPKNIAKCCKEKDNYATGFSASCLATTEAGILLAKYRENYYEKCINEFQEDGFEELDRECLGYLKNSKSTDAIRLIEFYKILKNYFKEGYTDFYYRTIYMLPGVSLILWDQRVLQPANINVFQKLLDAHEENYFKTILSSPINEKISKLDKLLVELKIANKERKRIHRDSLCLYASSQLDKFYRFLKKYSRRPYPDFRINTIASYYDSNGGISKGMLQGTEKSSFRILLDAFIECEEERKIANIGSPATNKYYKIDLICFEIKKPLFPKSKIKVDLFNKFLKRYREGGNTDFYPKYIASFSSENGGVGFNLIERKIFRTILNAHEEQYFEEILSSTAAGDFVMTDKACVKLKIKAKIPLLRHNLDILNRFLQNYILDGNYDLTFTTIEVVTEKLNLPRHCFRYSSSLFRRLLDVFCDVFKTPVTSKVNWSGDPDFTYLSIHPFGEKWLEHEKAAKEFLSTKDKAHGIIIESLRSLFTYLNEKAPYASNIKLLFHGYNGHYIDQYKISKYIKYKSERGISDDGVNRIIYYISLYFDYLIKINTQHHLINPITSIDSWRAGLLTTLRTALPYKLVLMLRDILAPLPNKEKVRDLKDNEKGKPHYELVNFEDWIFAQTYIETDWYDIDYDLYEKIKNNHDIPTQKVNCTGKITEDNPEGIVYQAWSPVTAMALYILTHLPLRSHQIRFLDSGEFDTFIRSGCKWIINSFNDLYTDKKYLKPGKEHAQGFIKRIWDSWERKYCTGFYINTNKTADQNKGIYEGGYDIPWENKELIYWVLKLIEVQRILNRLKKPVSMSKYYKRKHGPVKSPKQKSAMGDIALLLRDSAKKKESDKIMPVSYIKLKRLWYGLSEALENKVNKILSITKQKKRVKFVVEYPHDCPLSRKNKTIIDMHSMRVTLITAYMLYGDLPPVVIQKLVGHTSLLMTYLYRAMNSAESFNRRKKRADKYKKIQVQLNEESSDTLMDIVTFNDPYSMEELLKNRDSILQYKVPYGICCVGGREYGPDNGCWNGGPLMNDEIKNPTREDYLAVPNGPKNCCQCRYFATNEDFLPDIFAHVSMLCTLKLYPADFLVKVQSETNFSELKEELEWLIAEYDNLKEKTNSYGEELERKISILHEKYEEAEDLRDSLLTEINDKYLLDILQCLRLVGRIKKISQPWLNKTDKDLFVSNAQKVENEDINVQNLNNKLGGFEINIDENDSRFTTLLHSFALSGSRPHIRDRLIESPAVREIVNEFIEPLIRNNSKTFKLSMPSDIKILYLSHIIKDLIKCHDSKNYKNGLIQTADYIASRKYIKNQDPINQAIKNADNKYFSVKVDNGKLIAEYCERL